MNTPLLAKSGKPLVPERTLVGHTRCVLQAIDALFVAPDGGPTRLACSWLRFFGLAGSAFKEWVRHLRVAAAGHDWGKANDGFQGAVTVGSDQVVRHEHLSGLLLSDLTIVAWLESEGLDPVVILSAVISHHVKVSEKNLGELLAGVRGTVRIHSDHQDFRVIWDLIQGEVGSPCAAIIPFPSRWNADQIEEKVRVLRSLLTKHRASLRESTDRRRLLAAVRAGLMVADAAGSAVTRLPDQLVAWVRGAFESTLDADDIWAKVVKPRIRDLRSRGRWDDSRGFRVRDETGFTEFQRDIAACGPRVLLTTPCGSGKTLAAWNWITSQVEARAGQGAPIARVLFLYPTRATATEGFRDYVSWAPEDEAGLLSGTADFDLEGLFETPADDPDERRGRDYRAAPRLFALGHWRKRIFSATADQFFPFMQYAYGPLCLLPLLAESVLVVDEVHSFDRNMFSTLKRFLGEFPDVPVLCMTATLPTERRRDLVEGCALAQFPEAQPDDLADISGHPRYLVDWVDRDEAEALARAALDRRERVLWVSNRVDDCRYSYGRFDVPDSTDPTATPVICYHSRFRLEDRRHRHNELVHGFQRAASDAACPRAILGLTTQVCEMSLDIDADVIITALAPISSLIQRMGRCNRDTSRMKSRPLGRVFVVRPEEGREKPYKKPDLETAARFVDSIAGRACSQDDLERAYQEHDISEVEPGKICPFFDSGAFAQAREESFRDIDEFTVPSVLDHDVERARSLLKDRKPIDGLIVPVPRFLAVAAEPETGLPRWLSIASGHRYDRLAGFDGRMRPDSDTSTSGDAS